MFSSLMVKGGITLALAAVIAVSLAVVARNWSCRKPRPPRPAKVESFDVVSVPTGNSITVKAGRRDRTITITLGGIGVPRLEEEARTALEKLAGSTIKAELPRRRLRSESPDEFWAWFKDHYEKCPICSTELPTKENPEPRMCEEALARMQAVVDDAEKMEPPEARRDFTTPQAWGETGLCLQLEMLRCGLAISVGDVPKPWSKAEKSARKAGRGIWR